MKIHVLPGGWRGSIPVKSLGFLGTNAGVVASHQAPERSGRALSVDA